MSTKLYTPGVLEEREQPTMKIDTPEGKFAIPIVVLTDFQFDELINQIVKRVTQNIWGNVATDAAVDSNSKLG